MKGIYKLLLYIALIIPILYGFVWIHELGHVLAAILTGNEVVRIEFTLIRATCYTRYYNYFGRGLVCASGSLAVLLIAVPLWFYSIKKKNIWILVIAFTEIACEVLYWAVSPGLQYGDAHSLISWSTVYSLWIVEITVKIISAYCFIILLALFISYFYYLFTFTRDRYANR